MLYRYVVITFIGISLLLTGCAGGRYKSLPLTVVSQDLLTPPVDTVDFYYAVDSAETIELAKNRALSAIASRISVSVSSSLSNVVSLSIHNDQQDVLEHTDIQVNTIAKTIDFIGVFIEKTQEVKGVQYVLVKVDRNQLFQSYFDKMQNLSAKMEKDFVVFNQSPIFYQLKMSYRLNKEIKKIKEYISILRAMSANFDDKVYKLKYIAYLDQIRGIKKRSIFSIETDKNSKELGVLIKRYLSADNIRLADKNANIALYISTVAKVKKYKTTSVKLAKLKMVNRTSTFKVKGDDGIIISNNVLKTRSASPFDVEDAIQRTKQYEKLINEQGILSFITGNQ